MNRENRQLINTITERCRVCYTCVRECPAKAIRIRDGQAEVIPERCIGCGNCVKVCSQGAKTWLDTTDRVRALLKSDAPVAAILAPSFPVEFSKCDYRRVVGTLRVLGFQRVCEVAFGADLVAARYKKLLDEHPGTSYIATTCPAVVGYVERYHPDLVPALAPIVSPMVAEARALRRVYGDDLKVVFVGPCIAKKGEESTSDKAHREIDAAITFQELRDLVKEAGIKSERSTLSDFDPPHAGLGALFPVSRGILQTANIPENLIDGEVVVADGRHAFVEAIREFESGDLQVRLLETLSCTGCIMGPGTTSQAPLFRRRAWVSQYVRNRLEHLEMGPSNPVSSPEFYNDLDLSRSFFSWDQRIPVPGERAIRGVLERLGKPTATFELNCGACGYDTCREHAIAILKGLAESEMCLPYSIERLRDTVSELAVSNEELATTRVQLQHSEKLASMGQLAAGIAHEVNNPLGVVLMYAHLLEEEAERGSRLSKDLTMIAEQADRCKKIVSGLLNFARQNKVVLQRTDVAKLVAGSAQIVPPPAGVRVVLESQCEDPFADIDPDQVIQVLTNLMNNAYDAMPDGGTLTLRTLSAGERIAVEVADTGTGITPENQKKIFEPFFTTKQLGKGTGLGLAVSYGIVKMHRGDIRVESNCAPDQGKTGTRFTVTLPRHGVQE